MGRPPRGEVQKRAKERFVPFRPLGNLDQILPTSQHPTKPHDDNVDLRVFEIRALAPRLGYRLHLLYQGTGHRQHTLSSFFPNTSAALSILTSSFYKDPSAFTVEQAPTQELIAQSSAALRAARAGFLAAMDAVWEVARTGAEVPLKLKAEVYASSFYALDLVRETISRLYAQGTRAAFLQGNPVERALRNIHAIVFGLQSVRPLYDAAGRVLLGGEPLLPVF